MGCLRFMLYFFVYMKVYVMDGSDAWGGCMGRMHVMDASHAKKKTSQLRVLILFCFVLFVLYGHVREMRASASDGQVREMCKRERFGIARWASASNGQM